MVRCGAAAVAMGLSSGGSPIWAGTAQPPAPPPPGGTALRRNCAGWGSSPGMTPGANPLHF